MYLKQNIISFFQFLSLFFLCSCTTSSGTSQSLVLNEASSQENVTLDPYFLARQAQAEHSFFGFSSSENDKNSNTADLDDEADEPDTPNSLADSHDTPPSELYGGFEIIWPTSGTLTSLFGMRTLRHRTRMHTGIDIGAIKGTPIHAVADGQVLFAGKKRGYGYAVILSHDREHETLYAHMSRIKVHVGQKIRRNMLIGNVGKTGRVTGANLHFETRINGVAYNPMTFLPPSEVGHLRRGMHTPTLAEQLSYYSKNYSVALRSN
jgi:murein DD-endopeptidase MepM/ murein hydrolase activator NlpD